LSLSSSREGREQVLLALQLAHVHGGGNELIVVNSAIVVDISGAVHEVGTVPLEPILEA